MWFMAKGYERFNIRTDEQIRSGIFESDDFKASMKGFACLYIYNGMQRFYLLESFYRIRSSSEEGGNVKKDTLHWEISSEWKFR
jgi:hypothetical protein